MNVRHDVTHPDERSIATVGVLFGLALVAERTNPIAIGNRGLLILVEIRREVIPECVLSLLVRQAKPSKEARFEGTRMLSDLLATSRYLAV